GLDVHQGQGARGALGRGVLRRQSPPAGQLGCVRRRRGNRMRRTMWLGAALLTVVGAVSANCQKAAEAPLAQAGEASVREVPTFQVDPTWPKLPANWALGLVADVYVDAQDHVWIQHRFRTAKPGPNQTAAPPVLEFDADGNFVQGWGGPGQGYDW